jgi:hypothetical protein
MNEAQKHNIAIVAISSGKKYPAVKKNSPNSDNYRSFYPVTFHCIPL